MNAAPMFPPVSSMGTPKSGLLHIRDAVAAYFVERSIPIEVAPVGLKYRSFTLNQHPITNAGRVCFIPGEFDGSNSPKPRKYGALSREVRNASHVVNPRELLNWERPFTLSLWSAPVPGQRENEGASIDAAEDMLTQVARALQGAAAATITWGGIVINAPPVENGFGAELLVSATQRSPLFDETRDVVNAIFTLKVQE